jgi:hypothetical protein
VGIGERIYAFWRRLIGRSADDAARKAVLDDALAKAPRAQAKATERGEVGLAPDHSSSRARVQTKRKGGFNPYSNDAGYEKPRTWDDVDTRL